MDGCECKYKWDGDREAGCDGEQASALAQVKVAPLLPFRVAGSCHNKAAHQYGCQSVFKMKHIQA